MEQSKLVTRYRVSNSSSAPQLASSLLQLFRDGELTDVTLATDDGGRIEAHRLLLASSSPLLLHLLHPRRGEEVVVHLQGVPSTLLHQVVRFMYSGWCEVEEEEVEELLQLGGWLGVRGMDQAGQVTTKRGNMKTMEEPLEESTMEEEILDPLTENSEEVEMLHFGLATEQTNPQTTQTQPSTYAEIDFDDDDASYENGKLFESTSTVYSREVLEDLNSLDLKQEIERCPVSSTTMKKDEEAGKPGQTWRGPASQVPF